MNEQMIIQQQKEAYGSKIPFVECFSNILYRRRNRTKKTDTHSNSEIFPL